MHGSESALIHIDAVSLLDVREKLGKFVLQRILPRQGVVFQLCIGAVAPPKCHEGYFGVPHALGRRQLGRESGFQAFRNPVVYFFRVNQFSPGRYDYGRICRSEGGGIVGAVCVVRIAELGSRVKIAFQRGMTKGIAFS